MRSSVFLNFSSHFLSASPVKLPLLAVIVPVVGIQRLRALEILRGEADKKWLEKFKKTDDRYYPKLEMKKKGG